jgi:hypothetical protein
MGKKKELKKALKFTTELLEQSISLGVEQAASFEKVLAAVLDVGRGDVFIAKVSGNAYILAEVDDGFVTLVKQSNGNRYQTPVKVEDVFDLTPAEVIKVFSKKGDIECFVNKFYKLNG